MDQKVVCVFLLILGMSHGLQCYFGNYGGTRESFDAATAKKGTCEEYDDVCVKSISPSGSIDLRCSQLSRQKRWFEHVELNACTETAFNAGPHGTGKGVKVTVCLCNHDFCNN